MNNALKIGLVLGGLWFLFKDQISFGTPAANDASNSDAANAPQPNGSGSETPSTVSSAWLTSFEKRVMAEQGGNTTPNAWQWNWYFNRETGREMPSPEDFGFPDPSVPTSFSTWWARLTFAYPQFGQGVS